MVWCELAPNCKNTESVGEWCYRPLRHVGKKRVSCDDRRFMLSVCAVGVWMGWHLLAAGRESSEWQTVSLKGYILNILGFVGYLVSVTSAQSCHFY